MRKVLVTLVAALLLLGGVSYAQDKPQPEKPKQEKKDDGLFHYETKGVLNDGMTPMGRKVKSFRFFGKKGDTFKFVITGKDFTPVVLRETDKGITLLKPKKGKVVTIVIKGTGKHEYFIIFSNEPKVKGEFHLKVDQLKDM